MKDNSGWVLVFGASGNVGWGVARAALEQHMPVVCVTRGEASSLAIRSSLGDPGELHTVVGDFSDSGQLAFLRDRLLSNGPPAHVFASFGSWWQKGPIADQTPDEYLAVRAGGLDAHVHAAMTLLPAMRRHAGSTYTLVTGAGGLLSLPGTGLLVVAVSGVFGLSRMLRAEHASDAVHVNEVMIRTRVEREARAGVVDALTFGRAVVGLWQQPPRGQVLVFGHDASLRTETARA